MSSTITIFKIKDNTPALRANLTKNELKSDFFKKKFLIFQL